MGRSKPALIATTHQPWDHIRALQELAGATGVRTASGAADAEGIRDQVRVTIDVVLEVGNFEDFDPAAIHVRGHVPGSTAYVYEDSPEPAHIFSGDSLFPGGVGTTDKDPRRFATLYDDVVDPLFEVFPDDTVVHPGHGQGTSPGAERPHLAAWKQRGW